MTGGPGQIGHALGRRSVSSVAVLAAGSLLAAVGLAACGTDVAKADTVLRDPRGASVRLADGTTKPADEGMTVPKGATVETAPGGAASLVTAGRVVLLGADTAVTVVDGRRATLRKGLVMVDARKAGDLDLDAGAATVSPDRGAVTRVERDALLRVASFRRDADVRASGRRATVAVTALHQVQVPYGGVPGRVTALGLTRDAWERRFALDLVTSDIDLSDLAGGLARNPASRAAVVRAASFAPTAGSEQALGFLLARAAKGGGSEARRRATVAALRAEGGSWGVVAALVRADVPGVSAALDSLLAPTEPLLAGGSSDGSVDVGDVLGTDAPGAAPSSGSGSGASPRPTTGPRPTRAPSPGPSASPDPVEDVVTTVQSLLPTPPALVPTRPPATPSPILQLEVGGVTLGIG